MVRQMNDLFTLNPWSDLDRTFAQLFSAWPGFSVGNKHTAAEVPAMNVGETDSVAVLELEVPGIEQKDLEVTVRGDVVRVRGTWPARDDDTTDEERRFERAVRFREAIDAEGLEARLANGILTVSVPKAPELRPRQIPIQIPEAN